MSMTALACQQTGATTWRLAFASDAASPTFYVWLDGVCVGQTVLGWYGVVVPAGEYPVFAVYDSADDSPVRSYPGHATVQWRGAPTADHYVVERYVDGAWGTVATVVESGLGYYHYRSAWLADVTTHRFRVTPVGANGVSGAATGLTVLMVRWPDPPDVGVSYSGDTGLVTVAAN